MGSVGQAEYETIQPYSTALKPKEINGMPQDQRNLAWLDMEMTGLSPDTDRIIEVALVVTDTQLEIIRRWIDQGARK